MANFAESRLSSSSSDVGIISSEESTIFGMLLVLFMLDLLDLLESVSMDDDPVCMSSSCLGGVIADVLGVGMFKWWYDLDLVSLVISSCFLLVLLDGLDSAIGIGGVFSGGLFPVLVRAVGGVWPPESVPLSLLIAVVIMVLFLGGGGFLFLAKGLGVVGAGIKVGVGDGGDGEVCVGVTGFRGSGKMAGFKVNLTLLVSCFGGLVVSGDLLDLDSFEEVLG